MAKLYFTFLKLLCYLLVITLLTECGQKDKTRSGDGTATQGTPDGVVFIARPKAGEGLWNFSEIKFSNTPTGDLNHFLKGFGQNSEGEVFLLTADMMGPTGPTGKVYKLVEHNK